MGKGIIQSHIGSGKYTVEVQYDRSGVNEQIEKLEALIERLDEKIDDSETPERRRLYLKAARASAQKRIDYLNNSFRVPQNDTIEAWCADLTTDLSGEIGLIEIARDRSKGVNIQPGYEGGADYDSDRDGSLVPTMGMPPAMAYVNLGLLPGAQKWLPTYRYARIDSIDHQNNKCDLTFITKQSDQQDLPINETVEARGVPIDYMFCDSVAFSEGDEVIVKFEEYDFDKPKVIGFKDNPQPCESLYILIISTQSGDEAFAWDITTNSVFIEKNTLAGVQSALTDMGYSNGARLQPSNTINEEWYTCTDSEDPQCDGIVYYGKALNQPQWYKGYVEGEDPDWKEVGQDVYYTQHLQSEVKEYYAGEEIVEWDYPYIEHQHPITGETENKAPYIIEKFGPFDYTDYPSGELDWPCGIAPEDADYYPSGITRFYYWLHSIFAAELTEYLPTKNILDDSQAWLYESWYSVYQEMTDSGCASRHKNHFDFGIASSPGGHVIFEYLNVCFKWDFDNDGCEFWRDKTTGEKLEILRIYGSQTNQLSGLAKECFDAINQERINQGLNPLVVNSSLVAAAERHAADLSENFTYETYGHTGSDGTRPFDRASDADYDLWANYNVQTVMVGENVAWNNTADKVATAVEGWRDSPEHWANITYGDYDETGIGVAYNPADDMTIFVQVFGYRDGTWPGFAPMNTDDLLGYMNDHFTWAGPGDGIRVPKVYLY